MIKNQYDKIKKKKNHLNDDLNNILIDLKKNLHDDHISIIASFFKVLTYLQNSNIDFSIIFKTFGNDLPLIKKELNYFMQGKHPLYNEENGCTSFKFDCTKNVDKNYLMEDHHLGRYFRKSKEINDTVLVKGKIKENEYQKKTLDDILKNQAKTKFEILDSFEKIYHNKIDCLKKNFVLGLKDDYKFMEPFLNKGNQSGAGKLFLINSNDENLHEIFFDDNIGEGTRNMVDIWDIGTKTRIPLQNCWDKYLVQVDTIQAVLDEDYFIKLIQKVLNIN